MKINKEATRKTSPREEKTDFKELSPIIIHKREAIRQLEYIALAATSDFLGEYFINTSFKTIRPLKVVLMFKKLRFCFFDDFLVAVETTSRANTVREIVLSAS